MLDQTSRRQVLTALVVVLCCMAGLIVVAISPEQNVVQAESAVMGYRGRSLDTSVTVTGTPVFLPIVVGYEQRWVAAELSDTSVCLLYTSDAADERSSVDLGGRRIIKKKKTRTHHLRMTHIRSRDWIKRK